MNYAYLPAFSVCFPLEKLALRVSFEFPLPLSGAEFQGANLHVVVYKTSDTSAMFICVLNKLKSAFLLFLNGVFFFRSCRLIFLCVFLMFMGLSVRDVFLVCLLASTTSAQVKQASAFI